MLKILLLMMLGLVSINLQASILSIAELQKAWAVANYETSAEAQETAFEKLVEATEVAVKAEPADAALLIWQGIIKSTFAGKTSGLSALSLIKQARSSLEAALDIDKLALNGSAYTSLGALYYQVPGWPIAFGSDKKARKFLLKALSINPDGIDANYFYGDFLYQQKEYGAASTALNKALMAKPRVGREVADKGRRAEIELLLAEISKET